MEHAKFIFKLENNNKLPCSSDNYFTKLENMHHHNTRQKSVLSISLSSESGRKRHQYSCLKIWETVLKYI